MPRSLAAITKFTLSLSPPDMTNDPIVDFASDSGRQLLHTIVTKYEFPPYVLAAETDGLKTAGNHDVCAVLNPLPKLPTHDKASTWLSYAYFREQRNQLGQFDSNKIAKYLDERVKFWGIEADIAELDRVDSEIKTAMAQTPERYPVRNNREAKAANDWLTTEVSRPEPSIKVVDRISVARKIAAFIEPSAMVNDLCCHRGCYNPAAVAKKIATIADQHPQLKLAADMVKQLTPSELQGMHDKLAQFIGTLSNVTVPETWLQVGTKEPVAFFSNGAVVKTSVLRDLNSSVVAAARITAKTPALNTTDGKIACLIETGPRLADMVCSDLVEAGLPIEVHPPVDRSVFKTADF
jgi:hypothetical protein